MLTTRICRTCFRDLPLSEFRRRRKNEEALSTDCRKCHNQKERVRVQGKRTKARHKAVVDAMHTIRRNASDQKVKAVCERMIAGFGSVENFVDAWQECLAVDFARKRARSFCHLEAILRLVQWVDEHKPDYGRLSDAELTQAIAETRARLQV